MGMVEPLVEISVVEFPVVEFPVVEFPVEEMSRRVCVSG